MSYLLQQNNQEAEHPLRVPGLPADFEQPGWARPDHYSEALGQTKVPGHKSVSWLQLLSHLKLHVAIVIQHLFQLSWDSEVCKKMQLLQIFSCSVSVQKWQKWG